MRSILTDTHIYDSAPDGAGRLPAEMKTYALLDRLGITYRRMDHGAAASTEDCLEVENMLGIPICKNLLLSNAAGTAHFLLMLPGEKRYLASKLSKQIFTTRLSFADEQSMERLLHLTPGAVSVLALANDQAHAVRLLIDRDVLRGAHVGCHPCVNTSSLKISFDDLLNVFLPYTGHVPTFVEL